MTAGVGGSAGGDPGSPPAAHPWLPEAIGGRAPGDGWVLAAAVAAWLGAWAAVTVPGAVVVLAGAVAVLAVAGRGRLRWVPGLVALVVLGSWLGARAEAGLADPPERVDGIATLASDPETRWGATEAIVSIGGRRYLARADEAGRGSLAAAMAGERVRLSGRVEALDGGEAWLRTRHVAGTVVVAELAAHDDGSPPWRLANRLRRLLSDGATSLDPDRASLLSGLVVGDDRAQPATSVDDFRGSGLTHLLAVSGENVAFVLVLVGPVLRRLSGPGRSALALGVIAVFVVVTRAEPSVLRAGVMAAIATVATARGRPMAGLRRLALAVGVLVLVDPFLTASVGFQLSVAASAGILVLTPTIAARVPGPTVLGHALGVTCGAQLAVAPLLIGFFGGLPVVAVPANLMAGPAAGAAMTWGLGAGLVAGALGEPWAGWLHLPSDALVGWIAGVARVAARLPLGRLGSAHLVVLGAGIGLVVLGERHRLPEAPGPGGRGGLSGQRRPPRRGRAGIGGGRMARTVGVVVIVGALVAPAVGLTRVPAGGGRVAPGVALWRADGATVVVLEGRARPGSSLEALRRAGVRRIDLVAATSGGRATLRVFEALEHRWTVRRAWLPPAEGGPGSELGGDLVAPATRSPPRSGQTVAEGTITRLNEPRRARIGGVVVAAEPDGEHLEVGASVAGRGAGGAGVGSP